MKVLKYKVASENFDESSDSASLALVSKERYSDDANYEKNLSIVKREAYNGEYTIEDDGEPEPELTPTTEQRVSDIEEQLIQADETAIALYEAQAEQEAINAQQDEALVEIYEMIG